MANMQRTTVMLPADLKLQASKVAQERGVSLGELIRSSLTNTCAHKTNKKNSFINDTSTYSGDVPNDISSRIDDYLYD